VLATFIKHGDIVIEMETDGSVRLTRQSNSQAVLLSFSEWKYLMCVAELHGWPISPTTGNPCSEGR